MLYHAATRWQHRHVGENWQALASAVVRRRVELGHTTRARFVEATGMKARTMGDIETARRTSYDSTTLARLEQALQWEPGTVKQLLGSEPLRPVFADAHEAGHQAGPRTVDHPDEIGRAIHRDDFTLRWLLTHANLDPAGLLRVELLIRRRREEQERQLLLEVEAAIRDLGGKVSYPWSSEAEGETAGSS